MDNIYESVDKTIIMICEDIQNSLMGVDTAEVVAQEIKSLASLIEARSSISNVGTDYFYLL